MLPEKAAARFLIVLLLLATSSALHGAALPVGALTHDGPSTPEQLALFLPVTGSLPQTATATVRYKRSDSGSWTTGHPLYRIQPTLAETPSAGSVSDAFAWPIIGLTPGTAYDVEVTLTSGTVIETRTASFTTRALPGAAGAPTKTIAVGTANADIRAAFSSLNPGDVLQFENGTYNVDTLQLTRSGTMDRPIYIRGASRAGVVLSDPTGLVLQILGVSHVIVENLTLKGSGVDSGTAASSSGVSFWNGAPNQTRITIRNVTIQGVDMGIRAWDEISEFLAYDNRLIGNNTWTPALIDTNATWNDDGINIPGQGNCAFNNTLSGFGDSFAYASGYSTRAIGVHFYRNEMLMTGDDFTEVDAGHRNITFYDNRGKNAGTFISLDPLFGGPFVAARNIIINTSRGPFKWNSTNAGQFIYNNTIVRTTGKAWLDGAPTAEAGWIQHNNGAQSAYGYRNNILIYRGLGDQTIRLDNSGHNPVDFTHNSWFPDAVFQWPQDRFVNLAAAYAGLSATAPVFSAATKRHEQDNITVTNPWTETVTLGPDYHTEVTASYTLALAAGTAPKNSGVAIPNITDGFGGAAPDRGAVIAGRQALVYGDRSGLPPQPQITRQPSDSSVDVGQPATFWLTATGTGALQYQWQSDSGGSWNNIAGATSASYSFAAAAVANGRSFRCVVTDNVGSVLSASARLTVWLPPEMTSAPTAIPNPAKVNELVTFSAAATDPNAETLTYAWNFSDGGSATGASVSHAFAIAGTFVVSLTVSDPRNGVVIASVQVEVTPTDTGGGGGDGGDGGDAGGGGASGSNLIAMQVAKASLKLNFAERGKDSLQLTGIIPLAESFAPAGQSVIISIGAFSSSAMSLDAKGKAGSGTSALRLLRRGKSGFRGSVKFAFKTRNAQLAEALASLGYVNETLSKPGRELSLPVRIDIGTMAFGAGPTLKYSATSGKKGKATQVSREK